MENHSQVSWPYLTRDHHGIPVLGVTVIGPLKPDRAERLIRVDTGYEGFLLLSEKHYEQIGLHLAELPRRYWPEGATVTGEVFRLRRAVAIVLVPQAGLEFQGYVDTFRGNPEDLIGLGFLQNVRLLLEGPRQRTHILSEIG